METTPMPRKQIAALLVVLVCACSFVSADPGRRNVTLYFGGFGGYSLPFTPREEISEKVAKARGTYCVGEYDSEGRLRLFIKFLRGREFFRHEYSYYDNTTLKTARVTNPEGKVRIVEFDTGGHQTANHQEASDGGRR